jgi:hypothetical protein
MIAARPLHRRLLALVSGLTLVSLAGFPGVTTALSAEDDMYARLELPRGSIDFDLEPGQLQFFDEENAPFAVQIIDGCSVNGYYWIFGAGLGPEAASLTVIDRQSGQSQRIVLPAFEPGDPVPTVLDAEALPLCRGSEAGGLPALSGVGTYTSAVPRCFDSTDGIELLSDGRDDAYRTLVRNGFEVNRVIRDKPISTVDESTDFDELHLFAEGRTPRQLEGVVISGVEGMLPPRTQLDKALKGVTKARIRRAFETAKNGRVPKGILEDLKVKGVECVHHVSLDFDTLGADAYLAAAGWIKDGGRPLEPPEIVADRFTVETKRADGSSTALPLIGPLVGSPEAGTMWRYGDGDVLAEIVDGCSLTGSFWTIAATETDEPLQLVVTDSQTGVSSSSLLWTDRAEPASVADTSSLPICS